MAQQRPYISEQTRKEMAEFFLKTSIPRILAELKAKETANHDKAKQA